MSLAASERPSTSMSLPQAEINWDRLDKTKFFVVGTGLFTGVTAALYPFSVIKTRLQVAASGGAADAARSSALATARSIAKYEGIPGFYRGFGTVVAGTIPGRCVYLSVLEVIKSSTLGATATLGLSETTAAGLAGVASGLCASLATQLVVVPVDVISQRLMAQGARGSGPPKYAGGLDAFRTIVREQGVGGLYRGFAMSVVTYAPSSATWWSTYGISQRVLWRALGYGTEGSRVGPPSTPTVMLVQALGGTAAGGVAAFVTTPLDTVKTRLQVLESKAGERATVASTARELFKEEGVRGFYRGLGPRWASMALWGTCMITTYEFLKRLSVKAEPEEAR